MPVIPEMETPTPESAVEPMALSSGVGMGGFGGNQI